MCAQPSRTATFTSDSSCDPTPSGERPSVFPLTDLEVISRLARGDYEVSYPIGRGGMGRVYKATHRRLKRPVAIKVLPADRVNKAEALARFYREMEAIGKLDHRNIVRAYDAGVTDGIPFLVMEFVDGCDVATLSRQLGPLRIGHACEIARQTCLALQHVFEHDLVHRDVKPSNLLLSTAGDVKLADLGLARYNATAVARESLTSSGQVVGTVDYLAPEQAQAGETVDIRADLYSLGCTLYRLLTGQAPFGGSEYNSAAKKLLAHVSTTPKSLLEVRPDVPLLLVAVVERLMAKQPAQRFARPCDAAEVLAQFCDDEPLAELLRNISGHAEPACGGEETLAGYVSKRNTSGSIIPIDGPPRANLSKEQKAQPAPFWSPARAKQMWTGAIAVALLAGGALLMRQWEGPQSQANEPGSSSENVSPSPIARHAREDAAWWDRLEFEPRQLVLPGSPPREIPVFSRTNNTFGVISDGPDYFTFGEETRNSFTLRVDLARPNWSGPAGIFFGFKETPEDKKVFAVMQTVCVVEGAKQNTTSRLRLERCGWNIFRSGVLGLRSARLQDSVPYPAPYEAAELAIDVVDGRVSEVRWLGKPVGGLAGDEAEEEYKSQSAIGAWGVANRDGASVFHDAVSEPR